MVGSQESVETALSSQRSVEFVGSLAVAGLLEGACAPVAPPLALPGILGKPIDPGQHLVPLLPVESRAQPGLLQLGIVGAGLDLLQELPGQRILLADQPVGQLAFHQLFVEGGEAVLLLEFLPEPEGAKGITVGLAHGCIAQQGLAHGVFPLQPLAGQRQFRLVSQLYPEIGPGTVFCRQLFLEIPHQLHLALVHGQPDALPDQIGGQVACLVPGLEHGITRLGTGAPVQPQGLNLGEGLFLVARLQQRVEVVAPAADVPVGGVVEAEVFRPLLAACQLVQPALAQQPGQWGVGIIVEEGCDIFRPGAGQGALELPVFEIGVEGILFQRGLQLPVQCLVVAVDGLLCCQEKFLPAAVEQAFRCESEGAQQCQ